MASGHDHGATAPPDRRVAGITIMLLGMVVLTVMDALGKHLVQALPVMQMLALRSLLALVLLVPFLGLLGGRAALATRRPLFHLVRMGCNLAAFAIFFTVLRQMPLADTTAIFFVAPLMMTALSVPFLGEHVGARRWTAIAVGLVGVLLVTRPTGAGIGWLGALVLLGAFFYAVMQVLTRRYGPDESLTALVFYNLVGQAVAGLAFSLPGFVAVSGDTLIQLALMAVLTLAGHACLTQAFRLSPVSAVAPFEYTALPLAAIFGYAFFAEIPPAAVWLGSAVIAAAGIYTALREARLQRAPAPVPLA